MTRERQQFIVTLEPMPSDRREGVEEYVSVSDGVLLRGMTLRVVRDTADRQRLVLDRRTGDLVESHKWFDAEAELSASTIIRQDVAADEAWSFFAFGIETVSGGHGYRATGEGAHKWELHSCIDRAAMPPQFQRHPGSDFQFHYCVGAFNYRKSPTRSEVKA